MMSYLEPAPSKIPQFLKEFRSVKGNVVLIDFPSGFKLHCTGLSKISSFLSVFCYFKAASIFVLVVQKEKPSVAMKHMKEEMEESKTVWKGRNSIAVIVQLAFISLTPLLL